MHAYLKVAVVHAISTFIWMLKKYQYSILALHLQCVAKCLPPNCTPSANLLQSRRSTVEKNAAVACSCHVSEWVRQSIRTKYSLSPLTRFIISGPPNSSIFSYHIISTQCSCNFVINTAHCLAVLTARKLIYRGTLQHNRHNHSWKVGADIDLTDIPAGPAMRE